MSEETKTMAASAEHVGYSLDSSADFFGPVIGICAVAEVLLHAHVIELATHSDKAKPHAGKEWTDSGTMRDKRQQLKHREIGHVRTVPCPPELIALLQDHLKQFGTAPDGRLFRGERNSSELPKLTIIKAWKRARVITFTPEM
jgi:hypothetical protein